MGESNMTLDQMTYMRETKLDSDIVCILYSNCSIKVTPTDYTIEFIDTQQLIKITNKRTDFMMFLDYGIIDAIAWKPTTFTDIVWRNEIEKFI